MPATLTPEDLSRLIDLIRKAGGVEELQRYVERLSLPRQKRDAVRLPSELAGMVDAADDPQGC